MSSQQSSTTSSTAAPIEPANGVTIEYWRTEPECEQIHLFLCMVARPHLMVPIDALDAMAGIMEVADRGAIIVAKKDGHLIGTLGLLSERWYFNRAREFLTNRWFFVLPQFKHSGIGVMLEAEGAVFAQQIGFPLIIVSHTKKRSRAAASEPYFARQRLVELPDATAPPPKSIQ